MSNNNREYYNEKKHLDQVDVESGNDECSIQQMGRTEEKSTTRKNIESWNGKEDGPWPTGSLPVTLETPTITTDEHVSYWILPWKQVGCW